MRRLSPAFVLHPPAPCAPPPQPFLFSLSKEDDEDDEEDDEDKKYLDHQPAVGRD